MSRIIIGIHGMRNKPPRSVLKRWWRLALREGLRAIGHPEQAFRFELVYWAHFVHPKPLDPQEKDEKSPLFVEFPYVPAKQFQRGEPNKLRQKVLDYLEKQADRLFLNEDGSLNFSSITDMIIHRFFKDLDIYFTSNCIDVGHRDQRANQVICDELMRTLLKHRRKKIMLIGHSMGSIIAYDALMRLGNRVEIDTFVTMGSPLGLPPIMKKLLVAAGASAREPHVPKTPENIKRYWYNLADLRDKVAMNYNLADDYGPNSHGVRPIDVIVHNNYEVNGKRNPHKSYGYLRCPEMAEIVYEFLTYGRSRWMIRLSNRLWRIWEKLVPGKN